MDPQIPEPSKRAAMRRIGIHCLVCLMAAASHHWPLKPLGLPSYYSAVMRGFGVAVDAGADTAGFRTIELTGIVALGHLTAPASACGGRITLIGGRTSFAGTVAAPSTPTRRPPFDGTDLS